MLSISESTIEKELSEKGSFAITPKGESMRPMLRGGRDAVVIVKISKKIKKYDVVLFKDDAGRYVLHRVLKIKNGFLETRGDNTYFKEYPSAESVIGVLTSFNKNGKSYGTEDFFYKLYSRLRVWLYPMRLVSFKSVRILVKIYETIFKRGKNDLS